jgi:hypothetical protein
VCFGQTLLYLQFGDLCAAARRFRASRTAAALGHSQPAATASFRRARFRHGADEFIGPPRAPGGCPAPRAGHGERAQTYGGSCYPYGATLTPPRAAGSHFLLAEPAFIRAPGPIHPETCP